MEKTILVVLAVCYIGTVYGAVLNEACSATTLCTGDNLTCYMGKCKVKIGSTCTANSTNECVEDIQCPATAPLTCKCSSTALNKADMTGCMKKVGATCNTTAGDACVTFAQCTSEKCVCNNMYSGTYSMEACKKSLNQACQADGDCGDNAVCNSTKCACKTDYEAYGGSCLKKPGATCLVNWDCGTRADCSTGKRCTCKEGYPVNSDGYCNTTGSGSSAVISLGAMLLAVITTLLL